MDAHEVKTNFLDWITMPVIAGFALVAVIYILLQSAGGGYVDTVQGVGPNSGDPTVDGLALAIAHAEGFYVPGSRPARNHNPGDISDTYLSLGQDSGGLSIFADDQTGWNALTKKLQNILAGNSNVYPASWSLWQFGHKYTATQPEDWVANVVGYLQKQGWQVDANTALQDLAA